MGEVTSQCFWKAPQIYYPLTKKCHSKSYSFDPFSPGKMLSTGLLLATAFGHVLGLPQIYSRDDELKTHLGDDKIKWSTHCSYLGFESDLPYSCANFTVTRVYL